jgi:hypothetical protein
MLPAEQVDAMLAAPGAPGPAPPPASVRHPLVELVDGLLRRGLADVEVEAPGLRLRARRRAA